MFWKHKLLISFVFIFVGLVGFSAFRPQSTTGLAQDTETYSQASGLALEYVKQQFGIPQERLLVRADRPVSFPNLGREYQAITVIDTQTGGQTWKILVDLSDGTIEPNPIAIQTAEQNAYITQYGKIAPSLYKQLQESNNPIETFTVEIWVTNSTGQTSIDLIEEVASLIPEAQEARQRSGKFIDTDDPEMVSQIKTTYSQLRRTFVESRTSALLNYLVSLGVEAKTYPGLPSIKAELTEQQILSINGRDDIGMIYLTGQVGQSLMDVAAPTDKAPTVWDRGIDGSGVEIAVIEPSKIDPIVSCLNIIDVRGAGRNVKSCVKFRAGFQPLQVQ